MFGVFFVGPIFWNRPKARGKIKGWALRRQIPMALLVAREIVFELFNNTETDEAKEIKSITKKIRRDILAIHENY